MSLRSSATEEVIAAISKERANKAREFPFSTCVECGRKIPAGSMQRCELTQDGFCSWRVPAAVREFMDEAILDNSQNKPEYSLTTSWVIGGIILALMLFGIYLGVRHGF